MSLQADWRELLCRGAAATIFSTWEFQNAWWDVFGDGWEPHFLALSDESGIFGIAPLMQRQGDYLLVGGVEVCDYLDFLALPERLPDTVDSVLAYLSDQRSARLDLHALPASSSTRSLAAALAGARGLEVKEEIEDVCPRLTLPRDWDSYLASLSKKDRHELRRKLRRLHAAGEVRYYSVAGDKADDIYEFIRLHRLSRPDKAEFMDEKMQLFFHTLAERFASSGLIRLYFLEIDGQRVSSAMCFIQGQELWLYNSGYDPAYSHLAVGLLLKAYCLRDAIAAGMQAFDFLGGREPYKYDLGAVDVPVYRVIIRLDAASSRTEHV